MINLKRARVAASFVLPAASAAPRFLNSQHYPRSGHANACTDRATLGRTLRPYGTKGNEEEKSRGFHTDFMSTNLLLGSTLIAGALLSHKLMDRKAVMAESPEDASSDTPKQEESDEEKNFFQKNVLDYKELAKEEFTIPHLLQERE